MGQMMARSWLAGLIAAVAVAGCAPLPAPGTAPMPAPVPQVPVLPAPSAPHAATPDGAARSFVQVMRRMEPAVRQDCLNRRTAPISCDFLFVVDDRPGLEPNAFQTVDRNGRPVVGFTLSLIAQTQNPTKSPLSWGTRPRTTS